MSEQEASKNPRVEASVVAKAGRSSRLKAPVVPEPPQNNRNKVLADTKEMNPRDSVHSQDLPSSDQKEGKVLARSRTTYRSSQPPREQVCWEDYYRRQKPFTQGYFAPIGKPYQDIGEILYLDPKKLALHTLGQLPQEPGKKDVQEKPLKEEAEVTTSKDTFNPESDALEPVKRLSPLGGRGRDLRTLSKALARSRQHLTSVKRGRGLFHILHQESLERKKPLNAAQQTQSTRWRTQLQPPKYSSDVQELEEELNICSLTEGIHLTKSEKEETKITLRSLTPVYNSILITSPPGTKSEHLFRQLCVLHWLLEALTLESNSSMHSILTCWNPKDPGGRKKTEEEMKEEELTKYMWELFTTDTENSIWKGQYQLFIKNINKITTPGISQLSSQISLHSQTPCGGETSTELGSEDNTKINVASSDVRRKSTQAEKHPPLSTYGALEQVLKLQNGGQRALQKVIRIPHEAVSKRVHKQGDTVKKIGLQCALPVAPNYRVNMPFVKDQERIISRKQRPRRESCNISSFIESKSNLCADMRQKFTAIREEAACCLHDTLVSLERTEMERCRQKYQALKQLSNFRRDMERIRQLSLRDEKKRDEDGPNWFPVLLDRLPESVKSDFYVQKILKKLEIYSKTPHLKIHPDTFLKTLADLQVWELCSPEIAAAVEFVRESIMQMPEEDFSEWFETRIALLSAQPKPTAR